MAGRAGLIASPYLVLGLFSAYGIAGVVAMIACLYLGLVLIVAVAGIETNQRSLEDLAPGGPAESAAVAELNEAG
jgi:MFS transporter, putative metabolite:H+ symporter